MALPKMDETLRTVFLAAYQYLQERQEPDGSEDYWMGAAKRMQALYEKHDEHPLMGLLLIAVYEYLSDQQAEKQGSGSAQEAAMRSMVNALNRRIVGGQVAS